MPTQFYHLKSSLRSGLLCSAICLGSVALQTLLGSPVFGQAALQTLNQPVAIPSPQAAQQAERKKQISEILFKELEKLVPGEQVEGSPTTEALHSVADAYVERKNDMAMTILGRFATENASFPPAELMMAGMHFSAKNQNGGLQALEKAAIENPEHPAIYAAYGRLAAGTNRNLDAKLHFDKLLFLVRRGDLDKVSVDHYEEVYLDGMSQTALRLKDFELARNLTGELLKRDAENISALQLLARIDFDEEKLDDAVANLAKLRDKDPEARVPEAIIGAWYSRMGEKSKANTWFGKLPAKYANDAAAQIEYATWALGQEDIESASKAIANAEAADKATPVTNSLKGKIAFYQRKYKDAVAIFKALYEAENDNASIANMYVLSLIETSNSEDRILANRLANANMLAYKNDRVVLATLGYVRLRTLGINNKVKTIFEKISQTRDGRTPEVDYFLANFFKEAGGSKAAHAILQQTSNYQGLFLYRKRAEQMKQGLAADVLPTP